MKKLLIISIMLLLGAVSMSAQTYLYKQTYVVNKQTGVRKKGHMAENYFTISDRACYMSDKEGNLYYHPGLFGGASTPAVICVFQGVQDGVYIYKEQDQDFGFGHILYGSQYYYVASDKSRINSINLRSKDEVRVYERIEEPENRRVPIQLY